MNAPGVHRQDSLSSPRVLLVDDDPRIISLVREYLTGKGYVPRACSSGTEALEIVRSEIIDIVLLDVLMPDMDGFCVAKEIREHTSREQYIPIMLITGLSKQENKIVGLAYADDYITKPFSLHELDARIKNLLRIRSLERSLAVTGKRLGDFYEHVPFMCMTVTETKIVAECNTKMCTIMSRPRERIVGKRVFDCFAPASHDAVDTFINRLVTAGGDTGAPECILLSDREGVSSLRVTPVALDTCRLSDGLYIDVALLRAADCPNLSKGLSGSDLYRSARLASVGTLASGIAHEVNNPLTAILGFTSALLDRIEQRENLHGDDIHEYLEIIKSESLRCRDIIESLSRYSRDSDPNIEPINLLSSVETAVHLIDARARKRNISIHNCVIDDIVVHADAKKLEQAIMNILSNYLDYSRDGRVIAIRYTEDGEAQYIVIDILDSLTVSLEEFLSSEEPAGLLRPRAGQETGLGIILAQQIMEECGGTVMIFSSGDRGNRVQIKIPRVQADRDPHE